MPRSRLGLISWILAGGFILGTVLRYLDRLNLVATPPDLPDANMVDRTLRLTDYFHAIWPVFLWTNLGFAIGFVAVVAFAFNLAAATRVPGGVPTFKSMAAVGGIIGAIASIIPIGAAEGKVFVQYCDCGFKETEIVSQLWAQMVAEDIGSWFLRVAGVTLAIALIALLREGRSLVPPLLRTWTSITAIALIVAAVAAATEVLSSDAVDVLTSLTAAILVPVWAIWLARAIDAGPTTTPA
jgi:hypothetical protein